MENAHSTTSEPRTVTIFGTIHQIQGAEAARTPNIDDQKYITLVDGFLEGKDFVFEEASGLGPTKAEHLVTERLGAGHYRDIDPPIDPQSGTRWPYGIGVTGSSFPLEPCTILTDFYRVEFVEEQLKRESLWLARILETSFTNGLFICGELHVLSMAFRLQADKCKVEAWTYVPYLKLCPRPHVEA
jgi:hypothetical protein